VHASRDGDAAIVTEAAAARDRGEDVVVISADRALRQRVETLGCRTMSPGWLLDLIGG
jgi:rRNA-processing protein FCF1